MHPLSRGETQEPNGFGLPFASSASTITFDVESSSTAQPSREITPSPISSGWPNFLLPFTSSSVRAVPLRLPFVLSP